MLKQVAVGLLMLCTPLTDGRAATTAQRIDVPIGQMALPNGDIRYFVPVTVGTGKPIDALLDTGSTGLRVFKSALAANQVKTDGLRMRHRYASGGLFEGFQAEAPLAIGEARTDRPVAIQVVESVGCIEQRPNCPASQVDPKDFRMAGDGFAGKGFEAILGISMRHKPPHDSGENPLSLMGDASWIIELPAQGASAPGHLIINPTPEDRAGFEMVKLQPQPSGAGGFEDEEAEEGGPGAEPALPGWMDGALPGCLVDEDKKQRFCGKTLIDTGAPGFAVDSPDATERARWAAGTKASFAVEGGSSPVGMTFTTGPEWSTRVMVRPPRNPEVLRISAGTLPYFSYAILYDAKAGAIGFKRRALQ